MLQEGTGRKNGEWHAASGTRQSTGHKKTTFVMFVFLVSRIFSNFNV
jgi:hypothetical protein